MATVSARETGQFTPRLVRLNQILGQHVIDIPGNGIDQRGIDKIQCKLVYWGFGRIPDDRLLPPSEGEVWHWDWKIGGKGEYVGTLPKRIGKLIWQAKKEKLTREQLSELGNIGSAYSGKHCEYWFDIVDHTEWKRSDFGQPTDCCFWGCHASAKDMILNNGGGAIRFFASDHYVIDNGFARAWLAPWHDCWIVFNGYGLETLAIARILAAHLGHAYYRRVQLTNQGEEQGDLWINNGGYLIGPQESVLQWSEIDLGWETPDHLRCYRCEYRITEDDHYHNPDGHDLCETCYREFCFYCDGCDEIHWNEDSRETPEGEILCRNCWEEDYFTCKACEETTLKTEGARSSNGDYYCGECYNERYAQCEDCCEDFPIDDMESRHNDLYCKECVTNHPKEEENLCPAVDSPLWTLGDSTGLEVS